MSLKVIGSSLGNSPVFGNLEKIVISEVEDIVCDVSKFYLFQFCKGIEIL